MQAVRALPSPSQVPEPKPTITTCRAVVLEETKSATSGELQIALSYLDKGAFWVGLYHAAARVRSAFENGFQPTQICH